MEESAAKEKLAGSNSVSQNSSLGAFGIEFILDILDLEIVCKFLT
jgi:hypothetical protein